METYKIKETTVWGDVYNAKSLQNIMRLTGKRDLIYGEYRYPFLDHYKIYAFKPSSQRGPARESQTFIVSYTYNYDHFIGEKETKFISKLTTMNLRFYKEPCIFRGKNAYKILIMDTEVDLDRVLSLIPMST